MKDSVPGNPPAEDLEKPAGTGIFRGRLPSVATVENILSCYEKDSAKSLTVRISMARLMAIIAEEEKSMKFVSVA
jgi:hypothetical protein